MSETLRMYRIPGARRRGTGIHGKGGRCGCLGLVVIALLFSVSFLWVTRDSYPQRLVTPTGQTYSIVVMDLLNNKSALADSAVWEALPQRFNARRIPEIIGQDIGAPDWVVNNMTGHTCYITGNDLKEFNDLILITHMSRVGRLVECFGPLLPWATCEEAGGLELRRIRPRKESSRPLYYAVRGRLLVLSPSRDALVRALTLQEDHMTAQETLERLLDDSGAEQVRGVVAFGPDDPLSDLLASLRFALRIDAASAELKWEGILRTEGLGRLGALLTKANPRPLQAPPAGMLRISMDLGVPLDQLCFALGEGLQWSALSEDAWSRWAEMGSPESKTRFDLARAFMQRMGPGVRLSLRGVDLDELIPMPRVAGVFDIHSSEVESLIKSLPAPPEGAMPWDAWPRYDATTARIHIPMPGGPSFEPVLALLENRLALSTDSTDSEALFQEEANHSEALTTGNLYAAIEPLPCAEAWLAVCNLLADQGLLKGYTPDTLTTAGDEWLREASRIKEIRVAISVEKAVLEGDIMLACAPPAAETQ